MAFQWLFLFWPIFIRKLFDGKISEEMPKFPGNFSCISSFNGLRSLGYLHPVAAAVFCVRRC
jgi:hypothetical protein